MITDLRPDIREARAEHLPALAQGLRLADADELWAASGMQPLDALRFGLHVSTHAWVWMVDGAPACLFGVTAPSLISDCGLPWLMTTSAIERQPVEFLRGSRRVIAHMLTLYPRLEGYVDARYRVSIRWLRWLGVTLHDAEPLGPQRMPFHRFDLERSQ